MIFFLSSTSTARSSTFLSLETEGPENREVSRLFGTSMRTRHRRPWRSLMEKLSMAERLWFSSPSTAQMPSEFTRERYQRQLQRQKAGQEVGALVPGIGMRTEIGTETGTGTGTGITKGEVVVGVGSDLIVIGFVGGKESIVAGAGAVVQVLVVRKIVGEADMKMSGVVEAGHMIVLPRLAVVPFLKGAYLHVGHLLALKVLMLAHIMELLCQKLFHRLVNVVILKALLHVVLMLMIERVAYDVMEISLAQCIWSICFRYGEDMLSCACYDQHLDR